MAQDYPDLYDGYLAAAPAINQEKFGLSELYPQLVMKKDLGYTALAADAVSVDPNAIALRDKVRAATTRAVFQCDAQNGNLGFGFLLDPDKCSYNPATDAAALCAGQTNTSVTPNVVGTGTAATYCLTLTEANAINKIWYGETTDGSFDAIQTVAARTGTSLGSNQLWWGLSRGARISDMVAAPGMLSTAYLALALNNIRYATKRPPFSVFVTNPPDSTDFINPDIVERNLWTEIDSQGLADAVSRISTTLQPALGNLLTDKTDLSSLRDLRRKVIVYHGMAEEAIPHQGSVHYYEGVASKMGGYCRNAEVLPSLSRPGGTAQLSRLGIHGQRDA